MMVTAYRPAPAWWLVLSTVTMVIILALMAMGVIASWFPATIMRINNYDVQVFPNVVAPGQTLWYRLDYCKASDRPAVVDRVFVSETGALMQVPTIVANLDTGCHNAEIGIVVPPLSPGRYVLHVTRRFTANLLRSQTVAFATRPFTVVPPPGVTMSPWTPPQ